MRISDWSSDVCSSDLIIALPVHPLIKRMVVGGGFDAADDWIAERAGPGDVVLTADIPLAARCVKAGAAVLAHNGKGFSDRSIGLALASRNLMARLGSEDHTSELPSLMRISYAVYL